MKRAYHEDYSDIYEHSCVFTHARESHSVRYVPIASTVVQYCNRHTLREVHNSVATVRYGCTGIYAVARGLCEVAGHCICSTILCNHRVDNHVLIRHDIMYTYLQYVAPFTLDNSSMKFMGHINACAEVFKNFRCNDISRSGNQRL